jgi:hypothetical protein
MRQISRLLVGPGTPPIGGTALAPIIATVGAGLVYPELRRAPPAGVNTAQNSPLGFIGGICQKTKLRPLVSIAVAALAICALWITQLQATPQFFLYPLQSSQIREAYFLGRDTGGARLKDFLSNYVHEFNPPNTGLAVQSIEFRTPYEQVVQQTIQRGPNYSAQDAQQDYKARPNQVVIRVLVEYWPGVQINSPISGAPLGWPVPDKPDSSGTQPVNFWHGFRFRIAQSKTIEPKHLAATNWTPFGSDFYFEQWAVDLTFDAEQFSSGNVTVEVTSPDDKTSQAEFNLDKLK